MSSLKELANDAGRNQLSSPPKRQGLVVSVGKEIYCVSEDKKHLVVEGEDSISALCFHEGRLYDSRDKNIYDTLKNEKIAEREDHVKALCSHNGRLLDNVYSEREDVSIYDTLENTIVIKRDRSIFALCSHDGTLYDGGDDGVYDTLKNKKVSKGADNVLVGTTLCSHNGKLYHSDIEDNLLDTFGNKKIVKRSQQITALCSHNGILYDACSLGIYDTFNDPKEEKSLWNFNDRIEAIVSIDMDIWKELVKRGKSVK